MPLSAIRKVLLAKLDVTYGVDPVPAAATDAVLVRDVKCTPLEIQYADRRLVRAYLGAFQQLVAQKAVSVMVELEVAGFGSAGPASPTAGYDALLRMSGLQRAISAGVKIDYTPISTAFESGTLYFYQDGTLHKVTGARAKSFKMVMKRNEIPVYQIEFWGLYNTPTDVALPTPTVSAFVTPVVVNADNTTALALHGYAACVESLELDLGIESAFRNLINCTNNVRIIDRDVKGKIVLEAETVATKDWWTLVANATLGAFTVTHGPATNRVLVSGNNVQLTNPSFEEQDKLVHLGLDLRWLPGATGNDEVTFSIR